MNKYLPSKKLTFIVLGVGAVIVLGFFTIKYLKQTPEEKAQKKQAELTTKNIVLQEIIDKDTDGDGIKDWEEALWGTDSTKVDSNDDGVSDFDYISKKKAELAAKNPTEEGSSTIDNDTENFAKELLTAIIALRESGNLNTATINDLSKQLAGNISKNKNLASVYQTKDLTVTTNSTKDRVSYESKLQALIKKYGAENIGGELTIFADAIDSSDPGLYANIKKISDAYINFSKELIKIPVPEEISIQHLSFANSMQKTGVAVSNMAMLQENEIIGMIGIGQYGPYSTESDQDIDEIATYLRK